MKQRTSIVRIIAEVGIFAAIGFVLDEIQGAIAFSFTSGGSIGIAMVAVLIVAYRRGWLPALFTGLIMGALDFATKAYIVHPMQILLDYIIPYMVVGVAGFFKPLFDKTDRKDLKILWLIVGTVIGGLLKFFSHFFAGLYFWNDPEWFAWNLNYMSPALYSFVYNIAYIGPCIVLSTLVLVFLFVRAPKILMTEGEIHTYVYSIEKRNKSINFIISGLLITIGTFLFVFYLVKYINSFVYKPSSQKVSFDKDCMVIFIFGLFFLILGLNHVYSTIKNKGKLLILCLLLSIVVYLSAGYALARILDMYIDEYTEINNIYWAWFIPAIVIATSLLVLFIISKKKKAQIE